MGNLKVNFNVIDVPELAKKIQTILYIGSSIRSTGDFIRTDKVRMQGMRSSYDVKGMCTFDMVYTKYGKEKNAVCLLSFPPNPIAPRNPNNTLWYEQGADTVEFKGVFYDVEDIPATEEGAFKYSLLYPDDVIFYKKLFWELNNLPHYTPNFSIDLECIDTVYESLMEFISYEVQ